MKYNNPGYAASFSFLLLLGLTLLSFAQNLETVVQTGYTGPVNHVVFDPAGRYILTAGADKIKLWDVASGGEIRTIPFKSGFQSISLSSDGRFCCLASSEGTWVLDVSSGKVLYHITDPEKTNEYETNYAAFLSGAPYLVTVSSKGVTRLRSPANGAVQQTLSKAYEPTVFSGDGKYVLTSYESNGKRRYSVVSTQNESISFEPTVGEYPAACFAPDNSWLVTAINETATIWDVATGQALRSFSLRGENDQGVEEHISALQVSPDGKYIAAAGGWEGGEGANLGSVRVWEAATGRRVLLMSKYPTPGVVNRYTGKSEADLGYVYAVSFSPDSRSLVIGENEKSAHLLDARNGRYLRQLSGKSTYVIGAHFSSDGRYLVTEHWLGRNRLWDLHSGKLSDSFYGISTTFDAIAFSPDGKTAVTADFDENKRYELEGVNTPVQLWDVRDKKPIGNVAFPGAPEVLHYSTGGQYVQSNEYGGEGIYYYNGWNVASGKQFDPDRYNETDFLFSPDSRHVLNKSHGLINQETNQLIKSFDYFRWYAHPAAAFTPDGKKLLIGEDKGYLNIIDVSTGARLAQLGYHPHEDYGHTDQCAGHRGHVSSVNVSPDGRYAISAGEDWAVRVWDLSTNLEVRAITGHDNIVQYAEFSPDGRYLVSCSDDNTSKLWDFATGKELVTLVVVDENDYVIFTPENYYTASKNAFRGVSFRKGIQAFPFDQFDLRLNRPDKVLENLPNSSPTLIEAYLNAYRKRLKKMNFTEDMLSNDLALPQITIRRADESLSTAERQYTFSVAARDAKQLLDRINIWVNDVPVYGSKGIDLRSKNLRDVSQQVELTLSPGRNKIQVSVLNQGGMESLKETFELNYTGAQEQPDLYIIAVGVSLYDNEKFNLKYAAKDARDLESLLAGQQNRYRQVHSYKFLDGDATRENIVGMRNILVNTRVDDEVIFFIAGHGMLDADLNYFFATTDIDFANPVVRGLPYDELEGLLDGIPARKKLLLMDTCHSGEVDKEETVLVAAPEAGSENVTTRSFRGAVLLSSRKKVGLKNSFQLMQELFANLNRGSGAQVISAAGGAEYAWEGQGVTNGVFTHSVVKGIREKAADASGDGNITVSELRDYVTEKVRNLTNGRQTPTARRENLAFDFRVY